MPYNLLIFPLVGGYYFLFNTYFFKYQNQRLDRQRVLLNSIIWGIIFISLSVLIRLVHLEYFHYNNEILDLWLSKVPVRHKEYLWTSIASFLIAVCSSHLVNFISLSLYSLPEIYGKVIDKYGDNLEKLFKDSAEQGEFIQVTLKNHKVYVGFSQSIPKPLNNESEFYKLTPLLSGYRDSETKEVEFVTDYYDLISKLMYEEEFEGLDADILIKKEEIMTAGYYNQEVYDLLNDNEYSEYTEDLREESDDTLEEESTKED